VSTNTPGYTTSQLENFSPGFTIKPSVTRIQIHLYISLACVVEGACTHWRHEKCHG